MYKSMSLLGAACVRVSQDQKKSAPGVPSGHPRSRTQSSEATGPRGRSWQTVQSNPHAWCSKCDAWPRISTHEPTTTHAGEIIYSESHPSTWLAQQPAAACRSQMFSHFATPSHAVLAAPEQGSFDDPPHACFHRAPRRCTPFILMMTKQPLLAASPFSAVGCAG